MPRCPLTGENPLSKEHDVPELMDIVQILILYDKNNVSNIGLSVLYLSFSDMLSEF